MKGRIKLPVTGIRLAQDIAESTIPKGVAVYNLDSNKLYFADDTKSIGQLEANNLSLSAEDCYNVEKYISTNPIYDILEGYSFLNSSLANNSFVTSSIVDNIKSKTIPYSRLTELFTDFKDKEHTIIGISTRLTALYNLSLTSTIAVTTASSETNKNKKVMFYATAAGVPEIYKNDSTTLIKVVAKAKGNLMNGNTIIATDYGGTTVLTLRQDGYASMAANFTFYLGSTNTEIVSSSVQANMNGSSFTVYYVDDNEIE